MNALAPVVIETVDAASEIDTSLTVYQPFRAELAEFKEQNATLVFDYEDPKGNKAARSHVYKLRQSKSAIDQARKEEKAASVEYGRKVDAQAKEIIDEINAMIEVHAKPLGEIEQREKDRIAAIKTRIASIRMDLSLTFDASAADIAASLAQVKAIQIDASFDEFLGEAAMAKDAAVPVLERRLAAAQQREAEQAEMERLRREAAEREQRDRDERIAREAADKARREADEAADRQRAEAAAKAERERQEQEAARKAEIEAIERKAKEEREAAEKRELELKLQAERAEKERAEAEKREVEARETERKRIEREAADKAAKEAARQADEKHRNAVHHDVIAALTGAGLTPIDAQTVLTAIRDSKVPRVTITY